MGGDHAPEQVVLGTVLAAEKSRSNLVLVGDPAKVGRLLPKPAPRTIEIQPASEVVTMEDKPLDALKRKKDSSLAVSIELVKLGVADAFVSAGNTGAAAAGSLLSWRQIAGIHRPAIASTFPNMHGMFLLLDAGASPDVDPEHLVEFAHMGLAYAERVMGRKSPRAHLLNIGEEPGKGNMFAKRAHELMAKHSWFAGNIEGKDMFRQPCDVVVCDAFVGNIVLKTAEGVGEFLVQEIRNRLPSSKLAQIPYLPMKNLLAPIRKRMDYAEYGGSPLLGVNGICIICHGRSNAKAICNAILQAEKCIANELVGTIQKSIQLEAA